MIADIVIYAIASSLENSLVLIHSRDPLSSSSYSHSYISVTTLIYTQDFTIIVGDPNDLKLLVNKVNFNRQTYRKGTFGEA